MPEKREQSRCFIAVPFSQEFENILETVKKAARKAKFEIVSLDEQPAPMPTIRETLVAELARSDCIVADLSGGNPNVHFELGIAMAMGKAIFAIVRRDSASEIPFDLSSLHSMVYEPSTKGLAHLSQQLAAAFRSFRHSPRHFTSGTRLSTPFFVDWDRIDHADAENLCRELLTQMGLRRVDWMKQSKEIDLIAEFPRKDPDGLEYRELWLVSMGRNAPLGMLMEMASEPEYFLHRLLRNPEREEILLQREEGVSVTLLVIAYRGGNKYSEELEILRRRLSHPRRREYPIAFRVRLWDRDYLTTLVQQFPNIGYKYFSDEARSLSKFRKGPEELYEENIQLTERLTQTIADLEEEKNRRIRAERDAIWKDISFSAAHKIGNPIFAIETDLDPLRRRIIEDREEEAIEVVENIRASVEKAKGIVDQFKSLTKAQEVAPVSSLLRPILEDSCKLPRSQEVKCEITCPRGTRVFIDPERIAEAFDEIARNAVHWLNRPDKQIHVKVSIADQSTLPSEVDSESEYALVIFRDNGPGVELDDKSRIFDAFFTTHDHGTGLGLALVRHIIEGNGGTISESGIPGEGAVFEIYLPLAKRKKKVS